MQMTKQSLIKVAAVVLVLVFGSAVAGATCSKPNFSKGSSQQKGPASQPNGNGQGNRNGSITGLWRVFYSVDDQSAFQSFDTWHADGNEFEGASLAPGAFCQGTWEQVSPGTYKLVHVGWNFNLDGSLEGYFVEIQINSVSADGQSYSGSFAFQNFLMDGTPDPNPFFSNFSGTLTATRIRAS